MKVFLLPGTRGFVPCNAGVEMIKKLVLLMAAAALSSTGWHEQVEQLSRQAQGRVGAAAMVLETGESVDFNGDQHFPMQSVYKLPIGMAVLHAADRGALNLEQKVRVQRRDLVPVGLGSPIRDRYPNGDVEFSVRELLRYMVAESDGTASDVLLRLAGGPRRVTDYLRSIGVTEIVVATSEKEMAKSQEVQYQNWATPKGMLGLLRALHDGQVLSAMNRALLLQFMTQTGTGPHRIKGLLPAGTIVAHKTGTSGTVNGLSRATNDVGLITLPDGRHLAVAVFVSDSTADEATREGVIARTAQAAWDWSKQPRE
jgi:beta-lactamase class A